MSVGNVGQLACDVLISSLNAHRVGFLYDDSTVPVVGSDPFVSLDTAEHRQHVTTAVEGTVCSDVTALTLLHSCVGFALITATQTLALSL